MELNGMGPFWRGASESARGQQPLHVLGDDVGLEVDEAARLRVPQVRHLQCIRDERDREGAVLDARTRSARCRRPTPSPSRRGSARAPAAARSRSRPTRRATSSRGRARCRPRGPARRGRRSGRRPSSGRSRLTSAPGTSRSSKRVRRSVSSVRSTSKPCGVRAHGREAAAVDRDAAAERQPLEEPAHVDPHGHHVAAARRRPNRACAFDDAREHAPQSTASGATARTAGGHGHGKDGSAGTGSRRRRVADLEGVGPAEGRPAAAAAEEERRAEERHLVDEARGQERAEDLASRPRPSGS